MSAGTVASLSAELTEEEEESGSGEEEIPESEAGSGLLSSAAPLKPRTWISFSWKRCTLWMTCSSAGCAKQERPATGASVTASHTRRARDVTVHW